MLNRSGRVSLLLVVIITIIGVYFTQGMRPPVTNGYITGYYLNDDIVELSSSSGVYEHYLIQTYMDSYGNKYRYVAKIAEGSSWVSGPNIVTLIIVNGIVVATTTEAEKENQAKIEWLSEFKKAPESYQTSTVDNVTFDGEIISADVHTICPQDIDQPCRAFNARITWVNALNSRTFTVQCKSMKEKAINVLFKDNCLLFGAIENSQGLFLFVQVPVSESLVTNKSLFDVGTFVMYQ